ncbi:MAG: gliding motility-associated C-terminal domain-containing protein [Bacteroidota bacterium]
MLVPVWTMGEGTKEYRPSSTHSGNIRIGDMLQPDLSIRFATYLAEEAEQLRVRVKDPSRETVFYGFSISQGSNIYYRITGPDGSQVVPATLITNSGPGHISTYAEAVAGPAQIAANGYQAMSFTPSMAGDYIIEFNAGDPVTYSGQEFVIELFDITVYDQVDSEVITGRLWSQKWAGNTGNFTNAFFGEFFIYSPADSTVSAFDCNGMKPFTFEIFANSTGPLSTGNIVADRKSAFGKEGQAEYLIFLNPPDSSIFPYAQQAPVVVGRPIMYECGEDICIDIEVSKRGIIEVFIDLDSIPGFQRGGEDVSILTNVAAGSSTSTWNKLTGFGAPLAEDQEFSVSIEYGSTPIHIPIFDVESNPNGFIASTIHPVEQIEELHFDDSVLPMGMVDIDGCEAPCHVWEPISGCCNSIGNAQTINTWWFVNKFSLNVTFNPDNAPPIAMDDSTRIPFDVQSIVISYIVNDADPEDDIDLNSFEITNGPFNGMVTVDAQNGSITYTPNEGFTGLDSIQYVICDAGFPILCDTATIYISIQPEQICSVVIYEGFSPNGDGRNDTFRIDGLECFQSNEVKIFNRWGNLVYEASEYDNELIAWNGRANTGIGVTGNKPLPNGTYFYIVSVDQGERSYNGFVVLNR